MEDILPACSPRAERHAQTHLVQMRRQRLSEAPPEVYGIFMPGERSSEQLNGSGSVRRHGR